MSTKPQGEPDDEHSGIQFDEEREEQWLEEWEEAERDAVELLRRALHDHSGQPPPSDEPAKVAATVRPRLRAGNHPFAWIRQAAGLNHEPPPDDDTELLVRCAAATISPQEETGLDVEDEAFLLSLEHADWLGAIVSVVRGGAGADASPDGLVNGIRNCPEVTLDESDPDLDDESHLETAFWIVAQPWQLLGLIDRDQRLTALGEWGSRARSRARGAETSIENPATVTANRCWRCPTSRSRRP